MPTTQDIQSWRGRTAVDRDGDKIGTIEDIYLDRQSGEPEWVAIKTGLFGSKVSFAPIHDASEAGDDVRVGYEKDRVKDAPKVDPDGELSPEEERKLYDHYGRDYGAWSESSEDRTEAFMGRDARDARFRDEDRDTVDERDRVADRDTAERREDTVDRDVSGEPTDDAMTRAEDEVEVGTRRRETGRARLRKWVETENVEQTVPVRRETARVEREPITDENREAAMRGPEISEEEHEVTLHAEEPVVEKRTVPKERVRLEKDVENGEETISEEVRKERIETEGEGEGRV